MSQNTFQCSKNTSDLIVIIPSYDLIAKISKNRFNALNVLYSFSSKCKCKYFLLAVPYVYTTRYNLRDGMKHNEVIYNKLQLLDFDLNINNPIGTNWTAKPIYIDFPGTNYERMALNESLLSDIMFEIANTFEKEKISRGFDEVDYLFLTANTILDDKLRPKLQNKVIRKKIKNTNPSILNIYEISEKCSQYSIVTPPYF